MFYDNSFYHQTKGSFGFFLGGGGGEGGEKESRVELVENRLILG